MECTGIIYSCPNMNKLVDVSPDKLLCMKILPLV